MTSETSAARIRMSAGIAIASAALLVAPLAARQQPTFRSAVDLIAVDVQVIDGDGNPIGQLGPDAFEVSIKGRRRKVLSADFIQHQRSSASLPEVVSLSSTPTSGAAPASAADRTMVLAFDSGTFEPGAERAPIEAIRTFLDRLNPNDRVGLFVFPSGEWIPPTTSRVALRVLLDRVTGEKEKLHSAFNLRPGEVVDITTQNTNPNSFLAQTRNQPSTVPATLAAEVDPVLKVQRRECPDEADCPLRIYSEGIGLATQIEHEVQQSLSGLELLLRRLETMAGRKSVVLVSGGLLTSDRVEGRPDVGKMAQIMGQIAARANATVYTIHFDQISQSTSGGASQRGFGSTELSRDRALLGRFLDEFSDAAGGRRIYVPTGRGDFAFDRVLRESSAYYLLGVEPAEVDRDGAPRALKVKVNTRGLTVRSRQWVLVPRKIS